MILNFKRLKKSEDSSYNMEKIEKYEMTEIEISDISIVVLVKYP